MPILTKRSAQYTRAWFGGAVDLCVEELTLDRGDRQVDASLVQPRRARGPRPGWVVLHGITTSGRAHEQLSRFTRALVATGAAVIVPDVPEWRSLHLAPDLAAPTVRAGIAGLRASVDLRPGGIGVIGFSFGAPHAIASAGEEDLASEIAGVVGFGGYCDLERTFRFMMTGDAEDGQGAPVLVPDPYGRWVVACNYLPQIPDLEGADAVAGALRELAAYSGTLSGPSPRGVYDSRIVALREMLDEEHLPLFDLLAPVDDTVPDGRVAAALAERLAESARAVDPWLDPVPRLASVGRPVHILHGRSDRLISCAEAPRLRAALPPEADARTTVTALFGHSSHGRASVASLVHELPRFGRALSAVLDVA